MNNKYIMTGADNPINGFFNLFNSQRVIVIKCILIISYNRYLSRRCMINVYALWNLKR